MWTDIVQKAAGNENSFSAQISIYVTFYLPINYWLMLPDTMTQRIKSPLSFCLMQAFTFRHHTNIKCHQARGKTETVWNVKMKRENWGRRRGEEDNEKRGGGVKSHRCSPHPDTAGLQPCGTLIHHYRFTISLSSLWPPTQQCTATGMRSPALSDMHTSFDLKPSDQMNLYFFVVHSVRGGSAAVATPMSTNCRFFNISVLLTAGGLHEIPCERGISTKILKYT